MAKRKAPESIESLLRRLFAACDRGTVPSYFSIDYRSQGAHKTLRLFPANSHRVHRTVQRRDPSFVEEHTKWLRVVDWVDAQFNGTFVVPFRSNAPVISRPDYGKSRGKILFDLVERDYTTGTGEKISVSTAERHVHRNFLIGDRVRNAVPGQPVTWVCGAIGCRQQLTAIDVKGHGLATRFA